MKIAGIIVAAGAGRRMGRPKVLLPFAGHTFVEEAIQTLTWAYGIQSVVVLDPSAKIFDLAQETVLRYPQARVVENPGAENGGMLSSIRRGLDALDDSITHAALYPVDHPGIKVSTVKLLVEQVLRTPESIVVPSFERRRGHPGIVPREFFPALHAAPDSEGARAVLRDQAGRIEHVLVDDPATVRDVDTPADLPE